MIKEDQILHQFTDLSNIPCIFDKTTEKIFFMEFMNPEYETRIISGYLARQHKIDKSIDFFHRFILKGKLKNNHNQIVHHINEVKTDNRLNNLQIMDERKHKNMHDKLAYDRAFGTWLTKKYGFENIDYSEYDEEEFDDWIDKKDEENYY